MRIVELPLSFGATNTMFFLDFILQNISNENEKCHVTQNDFEVTLKCVMKIHIMEILNCSVHYNIME